MILHYVRRTEGSFAPHRTCSVEAMIEVAPRERIIRSTEWNSAGAELPCVPCQVVQNRRPTEPSSEETARGFTVDLGSQHRESLARSVLDRPGVVGP